MNFPRANALGASAGSWMLAIVVFVAAVTAGMLAAVVGNAAGYRAFYYVAVFALIVIGGLVAATRSDPQRFVFLGLIACFPVAAALVPPGRIGLTIFDVVMTALAVGLLGKKLLASPVPGEPLFPSASLAIAWLLAIPCVVFSQFPWLSLQVFVLVFAVYAFFLLTLAELRRDRGCERLVLLLSVVLLLMAIGLFVDRVLHLNLSLRGSNLNQLSYVAGVEIWRAGGFFQDPQRAGAFLASMITFLLILSIRGRFRGTKLRFVVWAAIAFSLAALATTISRSAIAACLTVSGGALFALNRWNPAVKLAITGALGLLAIAMVLAPAEAWLSLVPYAVSERFQHSREEFENRLAIWFDTWNMFSDHPLTGIGLGSFQAYLIKTQPTVFNYYGIGEASGVPYIPDQPENGYLKILYEGGILGSAAVLLVAGDALRRGIAVIAGPGLDPDARSEAIAALAALATFALTFVTLFTLSDQRIAGMLAFLLAVVWHRSLQRAAPMRRGPA